MVGSIALDGLFIAALVLGVGLLVGAVFFVRPHVRDAGGGTAGGGTAGGGTSAWQQRLSDIGALGRHVVDLASEYRPSEPGAGLTVRELGIMEGDLERLLAQVDDAQAIAPGPAALQQLRLVAVHAGTLRAAVHTERRARLSSPDLKAHQLTTLTFEVVSARSALDESLTGLSSQSKERQ